MNKILIIGTEPPCPRCGLLLNVFTQKVKELKIKAEVNHWSYTDKKSKEFAESIGLKTGTAKDVSRIIKLGIDKDKLAEALEKKNLNANCEFNTYNNCNWSYELDEFLRPYEIRAKEAGILMAPVVIINGKLMHQGSVPKMSAIDNWLSTLKETSDDVKLGFVGPAW